MTITKITNLLCPTKSSPESLYSCYNCLEEYNRASKNSLCECLDGYYQYKNQLTCQKCSGDCKKCNQNKNKCSECYKNAYLDNYNQCKCFDGYFININQRCEKCSSNCQKCQGSSNFCTICVDDVNMVSPLCKCPNGMYFDQKNQKCNFCSQKCSTCLDRPDQCVNCAKGYQLAPLCIKDCDLSSELDIQKNECVPLSCDNKCSSCIGKRNNCSVCRGDRKNPPYCLCDQFKYDDLKSENCLTCPDGEFIDVNSGKFQCQKCHFSCKKCSGNLITDCTDCYENYFYLSSQSTCECKEQMDIINNTLAKIPKCQTMMKMTLNTYVNESFQQVFRIQFSSPLEKVYQKQELAKSFEVKLENVKQSNFQIEILEMKNKNFVEFTILSKQIIPKQKIFVLLLTQYILYGEGQNILSRWYLTNTIQIQMRQDLRDLSSKQQNLLKLKNASESVQNNPFVQFVTQYYFFLFILSTLQPTILFILVSTQLPIMLELFLKIIGQFVFNKNQFFAWYEISQYQQTNMEYYIFFYNATKLIKNDKPSNYEIEQLGFMKNFIYNNQIPLLIVMVLCICYWMLFFIEKFQLFGLLKKHQTQQDKNSKNQNSSSNVKKKNQQYQNQYFFDFNDQIYDYQQKNGQNLIDNKSQNSIINLKQKFQLSQQDQINRQLILEGQKDLNETKTSLEFQDQDQMVQEQDQLNEQTKTQKILQLLQNLIISNMESNFAIYFISMGMQISNFKQQNILNRISMYLCFFFLIQFIYFHIKCFRLMKQGKRELIPLFTQSTKEDKPYYFHFYSLLGKLVTIICIHLNNLNQIVFISIILLVQILMILYIILIKPFKSETLFYLKLIANTSYMLSWFCLLLYLIKRQQLKSVSGDFYKEEDFEYMDNLGLSIIILLIIFNVIYLILFFFNIGLKCVELFKLTFSKRKVNLIVMYNNSDQESNNFGSDNQNNNTKQQLLELQTQTNNEQNKFFKIKYVSTNNNNTILQKYSFNSNNIQLTGINITNQTDLKYLNKKL